MLREIMTVAKTKKTGIPHASEAHGNQLDSSVTSA